MMGAVTIEGSAWEDKRLAGTDEAQDFAQQRLNATVAMSSSIRWQHGAMLREQRHIFSGPDVRLAEFRVLPGHPSWGALNRTGTEGALIVFPRTPVVIDQLGRGRVVADSSRVLFYPPGQEYRRELLSEQGDICSYVSVSPALFDEAHGRGPATVATQLDESDFLLHHTIRRRVLAGDVDVDEVREALYVLVGRVLGRGRRAPVPRRGGHGDVVEDTRSVLSGDFDRRLTLDEVAQAVHLSPFHLARIFRERTGSSIHGYRTTLRLRASLEPIADGQPLAHVAADLGFASHAHLSDRFRRAFGMSPQAWRAGVRSGRASAKQQDRESLRRRAAIA